MLWAYADILQDEDMPLSIDELTVSAAPEPTAEFAEMVGVRNQIELDILGMTGLAVTAQELWPIFQDQYKRRRLWLARVDGRLVGRGVLVWMPVPDSTAATINVEVLQAFRGREIGAALLETLEAAAASAGKTVLQSGVMHTAAEGATLDSPTGFGAVPRRDPGVRFLLEHGYRLEQVLRISTLDLTGRADFDTVLRAAEEATGPDYRTVAWIGETPERWRADLAILRTSMSVEDPSAGLEVVEDVWDEKRVATHDSAMTATGRLLLTVAAEHVGTGTLVGFTEVTIGGAAVGPAVQEDTLVLPAHRGHRLGMLIKLANIARLLERAPGATYVTTFNAEENRPMLDVNEAMGFRPVSYEGAWQKRQAE